MERLLTAKEAADRLGITPKTLREWVRDGKIPAIILPGHNIRFSESVLTSWVEKRKTRVRQYSSAS